MAEFRIEDKPFFFRRETGVEIFRGEWEERKVPIVLKRYDCTRMNLVESMSELNQRVREGLAQARIDHPYSCKLLDIYVEVTKDLHISVSHVLEALDQDVDQAIEERKKASQHYTEAELRTFLAQTAQALAYAHSKVAARQGIAHRDVKPANIFLASTGEYKVGDFGSFWEKKRDWDPIMQAYTESGYGTPIFMGPQMRQACLGNGAKYQTFKNDVYALGASVLNLATLSPPRFLKETQQLDAVVEDEMRRLPLSAEFAKLLRDMLSESEDYRPTMLDVLQRLSLSSPLVKSASLETASEVSVSRQTTVQLEELEIALAAKQAVSAQISPSRHPLAVLSYSQLRLFSAKSGTLGAPLNLGRQIHFDEYSSYSLLDASRLFCCGSK